MFEERRSGSAIRTGSRDPADRHSGLLAGRGELTLLLDLVDLRGHDGATAKDEGEQCARIGPKSPDFAGLRTRIGPVCWQTRPGGRRVAGAL